MQQLERPSLPRPPLPFRPECPRRAPLRCLFAAMVLTSGDWETLDQGERGFGHDFEVSMRN